MSRRVDLGYCPDCGSLLEDDYGEHWCPYLDEDEYTDLDEEIDEVTEYYYPSRVDEDEDDA
jgi:hypothetical protein